MTIHDLQSHKSKRARSIAEEGNKKLMQAARGIQLLNLAIDKFCADRPDYSEIKKAMDQIGNITINSIQHFYTAKLNNLLKPVKQEIKQEPANE